jgi:hypothetical protein
LYYNTTTKEITYANVTAGSYSNVQVAAFLPTYGGNIKVTGILNGGNAISVYNTLHVRGDVSGNGLFVGGPNVEISPYGNSIASFHGNANAPVYLNVHNASNGQYSIAGIALTSDVGDTSDNSLILAVTGSGYNYLPFWPNLKPLDSVIDSTEGNLWIGTENKNITFYTHSSNDFNQIPLVSIDTESGQVRGNLNIHEYVDLKFLNSNSKISFGDGSTQTTAYTGNTYGNVQVATYLPTYTGNISAGNVFVPGTSGKIGYSSGGFVQQTTSNATGVTSHFSSGNIQLMSIDLGVNSAHTVAFSCNKLTTNDMLLVQHVSGGITSVHVSAYVVSDGLAIIWMRDITGVGTGAFTPMLKYAIIRAPSS